MIAMDRSSVDEGPPAPSAAGAGEARLTLTLSSAALGALGAYLKSGAARGLPFEQPLLQALSGATDPAAPVPGRRLALSPHTLRKVQEFIEDNLARDFSVHDIAHAAFLSPYHLGRSFRQATGQSLWQYVLQRRAARARALIDAEVDSTLSEIAAVCGFESYSQFIAAFRKAYGVTPGNYRRLHDTLQ